MSPEDVVMTTYGATIDNKVGTIMTVFRKCWSHICPAPGPEMVIIVPADALAPDGACSLLHNDFVSSVWHGIFHRPITWNRRELHRSFSCLIGTDGKWQTVLGHHQKFVTQCSHGMRHKGRNLLCPLFHIILMQWSQNWWWRCQKPKVWEFKSHI